MSIGIRSVEPRRERGFSLIELLVSMFIAIQIVIAAAIAFDVHNRMAQVQTQITDLQQSLRVAQYDIVRLVRSAGRGGLPMDLDPDAVYDPAATIPELRGRAIEVRNNVTGDERHIARGDATSPQAIEGSDILTVRGCFSGTAYQIDPSTFDWDPDDSGAIEAGEEVTLVIPRTSVAGISQPLGPLVEEIQAYAAAAPIKGRMALVSPESLQNYGIANISSLAIVGAATDPDSVTLTLRLDTDSPLNPYDEDAAIRRFPEFMTASLGCFLEEYRYYVRAVPGDAITPVRPRLTRARFEPGTETPYLDSTANLSLDLADGILDLQVALGLDTDYYFGYTAGNPGAFADDEDNLGLDDVLYEADLTSDDEDGALDDWLYNSPDDRPADTQYVIHANGTNAGNIVQTYFVRVTTVARTLRPDPSYSAPDFDTRTDGDWVEDHDYDSGASTVWKSGDSLKHRRRSLTTTVEMRNI
jgi:type II secretory pathway pseudopilin PulG